jgi:oligopeptide/dipeptide ABC transporter ATP-binding protein
MYLGRIVEQGPVDQIFRDPRHPYTRALLSATPIPDPRAARERIVLRGEVPSATRPPQGCKFHPRCPHAMDLCQVSDPALVELAGGRRVACHLVTR